MSDIDTLAQSPTLMKQCCWEVTASPAGGGGCRGRRCSVWVEGVAHLTERLFASRFRRVPPECIALLRTWWYNVPIWQQNKISRKRYYEASS